MSSIAWSQGIRSRKEIQTQLELYGRTRKTAVGDEGDEGDDEQGVLLEKTRDIRQKQNPKAVGELEMLAHIQLDRSSSSAFT